MAYPANTPEILVRFFSDELAKYDKKISYKPIADDTLRPSTCPLDTCPLDTYPHGTCQLTTCIFKTFPKEISLHNYSPEAESRFEDNAHKTMLRLSTDSRMKSVYAMLSKVFTEDQWIDFISIALLVNKDYGFFKTELAHAEGDSKNNAIKKEIEETANHLIKLLHKQAFKISCIICPKDLISALETLANNAKYNTHTPKLVGIENKAATSSRKHIPKLAYLRAFFSVLVERTSVKLTTEVLEAAAETCNVILNYKNEVTFEDARYALLYLNKKGIIKT
ncbi:MAG: hypothetical protein PHO76_12670 [Methylotenera sp.]|nr:hypothetical protein [Methylotenera sp.]MDD4926819.1 hypothetical protein [Methylotenera sp.]